MKKLLCTLLSAAVLCGCAAAPIQTAPSESSAVHWQLEKGGLRISAPDGLAENAITTEETADHTVVRIHAPGTYVLSGTFSGQIAEDLGEKAKEDPTAVVTLILDNADITCASAPAVMFYNVYECGQPEGSAGANVILAAGSENYVNGSHTEDYDGALYSRMSMTLGGEGSLFITADNEGLCSEKHLTIDSGTIQIESGNDGINANEDGVSVVTVNGGMLSITVTGETGEGDGIDSNGSIFIKGGIVDAFACGSSMDSGLDADTGIFISGGMVLATGNMLDRIDEAGSQTHAVFTFAQPQTGGTFTLKNEKGTALFEVMPPNSFSSLLYSAPALLIEGNYTLWNGDTQYQGTAGSGIMGGFLEGEEIQRPDFPGRDDGQVEIPPQPTNPIVTQGTQQPPAGEQPENMPVPPMPEGGSDIPVPPMPEGGENMPMPQPPAGVQPPAGGSPSAEFTIGILSADFPITRGANYFTNVCPVE